MGIPSGVPSRDFPGVSSGDLFKSPLGSPSRVLSSDLARDSLWKFLHEFLWGFLHKFLQMFSLGIFSAMPSRAFSCDLSWSSL